MAHEFDNQEINTPWMLCPFGGGVYGNAFFRWNEDGKFIVWDEKIDGPMTMLNCNEANRALHIIKKNKQMKNLTESELWRLIESCQWASDYDSDRISDLLHSKLSEDDFKQLADFAEKKTNELGAKFNDDWLGNPGIGVSDDGWSDLTAEVVGRGEEFYNNITTELLIKMANENDYEENFLYSFH